MVPVSILVWGSGFFARKWLVARMSRALPVLLLLLALAPPARAHHAGGEEGLGLAWWIFGLLVLVLVAMAGRAFFAPGDDESADEDDPRDRRAR